MSATSISPESLRKKRILVVDDEPVIGAMMEEILSRQGHQVFKATCGKDAINILTQYPIDLVFLDLMLPDQSGLDLIPVCRQHLPKVPVVMITGYGRIEHAVDCFKRGASDFLSKPIDGRKILEIINRMFREKVSFPEMMSLPVDLPKIPGYRIWKILGEGAHSIVYQVSPDQQSQTLVPFYAMKIFKLSDEVDQNLYRRRFLREAKVLGSLIHPHIVKIYDYGLTEKQEPFLVMEYLEGQSMQELIQERWLSFQEKCYIMYQLTEAIQFIHEQGIVHRDIKPGNIQILSDLYVKLVDFGIAQFLHPSLRTSSSCIGIGTPAYLAPECFKNERIIDPRTDIFSLGVIMYELFMGHRPFPSRNLLELIDQITFQEPVWPSEIYYGFSSVLEMLLRKMLAKNPEDRLTNLEEALQILGSLLQQNQ